MHRTKRVVPYGEGVPVPRLVHPGGSNGLAPYAHNAKAFGFQDWGVGALSYELGGAQKLTNPLEENWCVYACLRVKGTNAKQAPLVFWTSPDDEAASVSDTDPTVERFALPNGAMTWGMLLEATIFHLDLTGECFWFMFAGDVDSGELAEGEKVPGMIWPFSGKGVEPWEEGKKRVGWKVRAGGRTFEFHDHAVLHFRYFDPNAPERGLGPIEALARILGLQFNAERYMDGLLRNNGAPSGIIYSKGTLQGDQLTLAQQSADASVNDPANAGKWKVVAGPDMEFHPFGYTPKDMEHGGTIDFVREGVCSVTGVNEILLGINRSSATFHNMSEAKKSLWTETLVPLLDYIAETITVFFLRPRGLPWVADFELDGIEVLREDNTDRVLKVAQILALGTGLSFNEVAAMVGLEVDPPEHGDTHWVSPTLQPQDGALGDERRAQEEQRAQAEAEASARMEAARAQTEAPPPKLAKSNAAHKQAITPPPRDRRAYWKAFSARVLFPSQRQIELASRRFLAKYANAQRARLRDFAANGFAAKGFQKDIGGVDLSALLLNEKEWAEKFEKIIRPALVKAWEMGLADAADDVGDFQLGPTDPRVLARIDAQLIKLTEGVNGTLAEKVRHAIGRTLSESSNIGDLQLQVRELLPEIEGTLEQVFGTNDARALAIARTESSHAANTSRVLQYQEAGIEEIEWIHAGPVTEDSRDDHVALDGQRIKLGGQFSNGLAFPHDPNASADQVVNCACISAAVIE